MKLVSHYNIQNIYNTKPSMKLKKTANIK